MENATLSRSLVSFVSTTIAATTKPPDDELCTLSWTNRTYDCDYVHSYTDQCEGGGYLLWTSYVICQETAVARGFTVFGSIAFLALLFLLITAAADDFFSTNVSAIIDHLKISQNIAGVTFMAFGNGAPDIFSSLASVISVSQPKAGLAIGELLGGGIFVTTVVVASIVLARPFNCMRRPILRDIVFYLVAVGWTVFVFLYGEGTQMLIWEPIGFIVIYIVYALTVIIGRFVRQRSKRKEKFERRRRSIYPTQITSIAVMETDINEKDYGTMHSKCRAPTIILETHDSIARSRLGSNAESVVENGKFFYKENDDAEENPRCAEDDSTSTDSSLVYVTHDHNVLAVSDVRASTAHIPQLPPPPEADITWQGVFFDALKHLNPIDIEEFDDASIFSKVFMICRAPIMFILKCSTPLAESSWSKPIALLHAFTAPIFLVFAFQLASKEIGPIGIWAFALMISAIIALLLAFFTEFSKTPKYYKQFACYAGFIMSVAWIYAISSEVVDVVNMLGIMSGVSHEVLGLTILAWSNSIGDLIADISVARQGFPRMAISAAIAGPCFNLLIGFGFPFLIACIQGKSVIIELDTVKKTMLVFLAISLLTSLILLPVQRFNARRPYALVLIFIYAVFLVLVVLAELKIYSF